MRIEDSEISIVLQGPIYKGTTSRVCKRMREIFPNAEIIVSTWEGSDTSGLIYDILLENKDPGGTPLMLDGELNNKTNKVDRMILSSKNCIKKRDKLISLENYCEKLEKIYEDIKNHDKS